MITFETAKLVTTDPFMIMGFVVVWLVPLLVWLILGLTIKGKYGKYMASYPNYWYAFVIWGLIQLTLFILIIFPVWLKIF